ncbi:unnamed protein product [Effrenium voratum]|uniref:Chloride channel protein n=1 Tax=Effrenium voratum TaxID=2562239 RepID=A0AA36MU48_9DINO|nr:unnamed protein product [Effrenium voratum]CAJ1380399.1 unnamed protein product [Effrenium voratum]CAJ1450381.1 unnamed protein product [Effrenium voratum]
MVVPGATRYLSRIESQPRTYSKNLKAPAGTESIGYAVNESAQHIDYFERVGLFSKSFNQSVWFSFGAMRWLLLVAIGLGAGLVAVCVELALHYLTEEKIKLIDWVGENTDSIGLQYLFDVSFCLCSAAIAGILVCFVEVLAAGSGIPEIKCFLNGIHLPKLVTKKTLFAKAAGIVFSVTAGLPCGKEGPMIHSGAIVGAMVAYLNLERRLRPMNLDVEMRDFVAAGAAAGVSAAFGAPIGAVLFAVEEGASHMTPRILTQLFVSSSVATLVTRLTLGPILEHRPIFLLGTGVPVSFGRFKDEIQYNFIEMVIFVIMGVCAGLLGALFNHFNGRLSKWRKRHIGPTGCKRFIEVLLVTFAIVSLKFWVPTLWKFAGEGAYQIQFEELTHTQQLWFESGQMSLSDLFHKDTGFEDIGLLFFFGLFNLAIACWTFGLGVPSGLFVPSLLTGAVLGRCVGELLRLAPHWVLVHWAHPGIYALVGACGMLAGVGRITISLAMILTEATGTGVFGLPIFTVVVIATWVGNYFNRGIYDLHIIELKQIPLLEHTPADVMVRYSVRDVMATEVVALDSWEKVGNLLQILDSCGHNGFPVLQSGTKKLEGLIGRSFLHLLLSRGRYYGLFTPEPEHGGTGSILPFEAIAWPNINQYPDLPELQKRISKEDLEMYIDLRPYVTTSYTITPNASMASAFTLLRQLGLRHLPVLESNGDLCGILTRKDLILMEEDEETGEMVQRSRPPARVDTLWSWSLNFRKAEIMESDSAEDTAGSEMTEEVRTGAQTSDDENCCAEGESGPIGGSSGTGGMGGIGA